MDTQQTSLFMKLSRFIELSLLLVLCAFTVLSDGQWFFPRYPYYHLRPVSRTTKQKTGNSVSNHVSRKPQPGSDFSTLNKLEQGLDRDDEDDEYLRQLEGELQVDEETQVAKNEVPKASKRRTFRKRQKKIYAGEMLEQQEKHASKRSSGHVQPCSPDLELPHISRRGSMHIEYTTHYPLSCPCRQVNGIRLGTCWVLIDSVNHICVKRNCNPSFVCVYGIRTGLMCLRKKVTKKVVPTGQRTCKTVSISGYMYVPYTS